MVVYVINGDGSGLIIKRKFNCILLHYNGLNELAGEEEIATGTWYSTHDRLSWLIWRRGTLNIRHCLQDLSGFSGSQADLGCRHLPRRSLLNRR